MTADNSAHVEHTDRRRSTARTLFLGVLLGLPAGLVLGLTVFDNLAVGLIMGFSIGMVAAIAYTPSGNAPSTGSGDAG